MKVDYGKTMGGYEMFGTPCNSHKIQDGCYWWESEDAQKAIWWANDAWHVGPKVDMGNYNEGDLKGMEGLLILCPHAIGVTGLSVPWSPLPREQQRSQWKYKKPVDELGFYGYYSWTNASCYGVFTVTDDIETCYKN